jgi:hypothetical protein
MSVQSDPKFWYFPLFPDAPETYATPTPVMGNRRHSECAPGQPFHEAVEGHSDALFVYAVTIASLIEEFGSPWPSANTGFPVAGARD